MSGRHPPRCAILSQELVEGLTSGSVKILEHPEASSLGGASLTGPACSLAGFTTGRSSRVVTEEVECLSAHHVIGCTLSDGWDVSVPLDVTWTDASGVFHEDGRPECLPPTGRGLEGPVRVSWTEVEADGRGWRQVLSVACVT